MRSYHLSPGNGTFRALWTVCGVQRLSGWFLWARVTSTTLDPAFPNRVLEAPSDTRPANTEEAEQTAESEKLEGSSLERVAPLIAL